MRKYLPILFLTLALTGCRQKDHSTTITSIQVVDRNGFSETISNKERLGVYQNVDFLTAQPYEKVLRVYGKDQTGKSHSKLTSYHDNGGVWQYLEAVDGRANGKYLEWHPNGKVKIEGTVIEGLADLSISAQKSWLFDDKCIVWHEKGTIEAEFTYDKGDLVEMAKYYYPSGKTRRLIPYTKGLVHGTIQAFDEEGKILETIEYNMGKKEGKAIAKWTPDLFKYQEQYRDGFLYYGTYFDPSGKIIAEIQNGSGKKALYTNDKLYSLTDYKNGAAEGIVKIYNPEEFLQTTYQLKKGMKTGEEWEYYSPISEEKRPKLLINWFEDQIQGIVKTWYENSVLESQREMSGNKKHGLSFAYYQTGDLMMMEEYENDRLIRGSYFKKGEKEPTTTIEKGEGVATLYNSEGHFMKKVGYERGKPVVD